MESILKVVRKNPKGRTSTSKASKHRKLGEHWGEDNQQVKDGVAFYLKYLGSTLVAELEEEGASYGDNISAEAVKTIVNMAKMSGKKLPKTSITVGMNGIKVVDMTSNVVKTDLPLYRISFCTADRFHEKVFAYIARNMDNETMECHAFLCTKRKIAQAVTLTVARAFKTAQEEWEQEEKSTFETSGNQEKETSNGLNCNGQSRHEDEVIDNLLDFSSENVSSENVSSENVSSENGFEDNFICKPSYGPDAISKEADSFSAPVSDNKSSPMCFEDDFNVEDDFSSLAESRSTNARPSPFTKFSTGLKMEDLEDGVQQLMSGEKMCEISRQLSNDDLLSL